MKFFKGVRGKVSKGRTCKNCREERTLYNKRSESTMVLNRSKGGHRGVSRIGRRGEDSPTLEQTIQAVNGGIGVGDLVMDHILWNFLLRESKCN